MEPVSVCVSTWNNRKKLIIIPFSLTSANTRAMFFQNSWLLNAPRQPSNSGGGEISGYAADGQPAKNGAVRNRFENQSRTIKRRETSKTGVKSTEKEEEETKWKADRERGAAPRQKWGREKATKRRTRSRATKGKEGGVAGGWKESKGGRSKVREGEKKDENRGCKIHAGCTKRN